MWGEELGSSSSPSLQKGEELRVRKRVVEYGRGSDLHKYIEFIEMSLGIAARRILAAYQPPRRFQTSNYPLVSSSSSSFSHLLRSYRWFIPSDNEEAEIWMRFSLKLHHISAIGNYYIFQIYILLIKHSSWIFTCQKVQFYTFIKVEFYTFIKVEFYTFMILWFVNLTLVSQSATMETPK